MCVFKYDRYVLIREGLYMHMYMHMTYVHMYCKLYMDHNNARIFDIALSRT